MKLVQIFIKSDPSNICCFHSTTIASGSLEVIVLLTFGGISHECCLLDHVRQTINPAEANIGNWWLWCVTKRNKTTIVLFGGHFIYANMRFAFKNMIPNDELNCGIMKKRNWIIIMVIVVYHINYNYNVFVGMILWIILLQVIMIDEL